MDKNHKHYAIAKQWLEGAKIQCFLFGNGWTDVDNPVWGELYEYRVKPIHKWQHIIDAFERGEPVEYKYTFNDENGNQVLSDWHILVPKDKRIYTHDFTEHKFYRVKPKTKRITLDVEVEENLSEEQVLRSFRKWLRERDN